MIFFFFWGDKKFEGIGGEYENTKDLRRVDIYNIYCYFTSVDYMLSYEGAHILRHLLIKVTQ